MKYIIKWKEHGNAYVSQTIQVEIEANNLEEAQRKFENKDYDSDIEVIETDIEEWCEEWCDVHTSEPIWEEIKEK